MANAVNTTPVNTQDIVDRVIGKGIGFMTSYIREYPGFAYLGFWPSNWYRMQRNINGSSAGAMFQLEGMQDSQFAKISKIESTVSETGTSVSWYEGDSFSTSSEITTDSITTEIIVESVGTFAINDYVRTIPAKGSAGTETQVTITGIDPATNTLTVSSAVSVKDGDKVIFIAPKLTLGDKVQRTVSDPTAKLVTTYFQKFGGSVSIQAEELNKTRLLVDVKTFLSNEFNKPKMQILENIISSWFFGQNNGGNSPELQGYVTLIDEREARGQTSRFSLAAMTTDQTKLRELQRILNLASTAPVYTGNEKPTVFCNTEFASVISGLLRSDVVYQNFIPKTIEYGLESLSTPYFRNINFIVLPEMDRIYSNDSKAFVFPKELVGFRVPENEFMNEQGVAVKTQANRFCVIKQPVTTNDFREYTFEYKLANVFAGQSYDNAYMILEDLEA
jgi:hypothetical protein